MVWISIRNRWPEDRAVYKVKDCIKKYEWELLYNGYDFVHLEFSLSEPEVTKYTVTHWWEERVEKPEESRGAFTTATWWYPPPPMPPMPQMPKE